MITVIAWHREAAEETARNQAVFDQQAVVLGNALQERLSRYEGLVSAARAALPAAGPAGEEVLRRFVPAEDILNRYPGIAGFGLAVMVPPADLARFTAARIAVQPDFRITPKAGAEPPAPGVPVSSGLPAYVVVQAMPPAVGGMVGYDLATDDVRRQTADQARDSGRVALSRRLTLLSPGASGSDVLMMAAVYRGGTVPATVEERRAALSGWVVAALRMGPLADSLLTGQPGIDMTLTDITEAQPGIPMYERRGLVMADQDAVTVSRAMALHIGERVWEVRFTALAGGLTGAHPASTLILWGGVGMSVLLWGGLGLLSAGRRMAEARARRSADALSLTEATYRRFIAATAEGYLEVDADGCIIDVNDALCRILERPRTELVGTPLLDLSTNSSRAVIAHHLTRRTIGDQRCYEVTLRGGNGRRVNLRVNATTTAGPPDGRLHSSALMTDITAQTRLQEQMHAAQMRLEQIFAAAPVAMAVVRLEDGVVVQANRSASALFGAGAGAGPAHGGEGGEAVVPTLSGHNFFPYIANPEDVRSLMAAVRANGSVRGFEVRMMRPDGTLWWAMLSAARFLHGGDLAMLVGCQNIDAVKKGQEAQKLAAAILESVRDGVMVLSLDHRIEQVNPAFTWITGYPADEAVGQPPSLLESGRQAESLYDAVWAGVERAGFWSGDLWLRRRSGEAFVSSTSVAPIRPGGGAPTHYVAVMHDITSRKEDEDRTWKLANYDALTGLPNRLLFADRLSQAVGRAQRAGGRFALLYLDLDGFKPINDRWGHGAGDQVLQETATRLLACVRGSDTVARVGGDEFIIILADAQDRATARAVAQKIVDTLCRPIALTVQDAQVDGAVTASVGMAVYAVDGATPDALVAAADAAMYHAKAKGKNRCTFPPDVEALMG
ncbi:diguanylate cyclase (GGDEF)-like protein/PAS domain S-box-containing protein [Azospirillum fermentarium]|uniref:sensor domain-containing diguanylate cyclase n=1 Tax=Azospirillum fermentarium TaxID=1233114 RepID=UPI0022280245|nr:diguanylate cyclase [Azospirillum fermentarium]MCW2245469.1 diguanylate cyclase (GGDEF)-like protein/PAS domain S-box-containing protein [Azospirillum fermentarium]